MRRPKVARVAWRPSYRIISSRFPPVGIFDEITDPADLDAVHEIEGLTDSRRRHEQLGEIGSIPNERWVLGPGSTPVMAAFAHSSPDGSRFSDGTFGVYYAARDRDTAIAETVYHRQAFLALTREAATVIEMRCFLADITARLHDVRGGQPEIHDPESYAASQRLARELRGYGSDGVVYDSVRHTGGECLAAFFPDVVTVPVTQGARLLYHWNGGRITHVTIAGEVINLP